MLPAHRLPGAPALLPFLCSLETLLLFRALPILWTVYKHGRHGSLEHPAHAERFRSCSEYSSKFTLQLRAMLLIVLDHDLRGWPFQQIAPDNVVLLRYREFVTTNLYSIQSVLDNFCFTSL